VEAIVAVLAVVALTMSLAIIALTKHAEKMQDELYSLYAIVDDVREDLATRKNPYSDEKPEPYVLTSTHPATFIADSYMDTEGNVRKGE
jgi:hypothetical protein